MNSSFSSAIEQTRAQAFKEFRSLLSEALSSAVADDRAPDAFKSAIDWQNLIAQTESRVAQGWRDRFEAMPGGAKRLAADTLNLVTDEDHEQQVLTERFINEVSQQGRQSLDDLDEQLAMLSGDERGEFDENPIGPTAWIEGIRSSMQDLSCAPDDRAWLLERLIGLLVSQMGGFYSGLNRKLVSAGVVPGHRVDPHALAAALPKVFDAESAAPAMSSALADMFSPTAAGTGSTSGSVDPLEQLFGLMSARRAAAPKSALGPGVNAWSQSDLMSVLSAVQARKSGGASSGQSLVHWQDALAETAGKMGVRGGIAAMPEAAQDILELVNMLFEALLDGRRLDGKARTELGRLVIPYVRVALLDRHLFMQSAHPARRVLNLLVEACELASPDAPQFRAVRDLAFIVVDRISNEFTDDIGLFAILEASLSVAMEDARRRADIAERRSADVELGKERRETAQVAVAAIAQEICAGTKIPSELQTFIDGPWQHHQVIHWLREGDKGEGVQQGNRLLAATLQCWRSRAPERLHDWRAALAEVLASSGEQDDAVERFIDAITLAIIAAEPESSDTVAAPDFLPPSMAASLPDVSFADFEVEQSKTVRAVEDNDLMAGMDDFWTQGALSPLLIEETADSVPAFGAGKTIAPIEFEGDTDSFLAESLDFSHQFDALGLVEDIEAAFGAQAVESEAPVVEAALPWQVPEILSDAVALPETTVLASQESALPPTPPTTTTAVLEKFEPELVERITHYRKIATGTWLDFVDEDGRITSGKISWTSPISGRHILSNRRGQRILLASAEELAEMELDGRIRPRHSESAVDYAMHLLSKRLDVGDMGAAA